MSRSPEAPDDLPPPAGPPPEPAMGGAGDFGAHGGHQASSPAMKREHRAAEPDRVPGDAAIERRHRLDPSYSGPERRLARR
ncbi:MAG: hypothetical protein H0T68_15310 [Gemmatimonadales bacterium]|nr:hypothetical protein [Gemmatimonadales bacterium]MBA3556627.1 hypothetical protein [Gemmatimonadales bacterium]